MISAFFDDQTGFKKSVFTSLILSVLLMVGANLLIELFQQGTLENQKLAVMYSAQEQWLKEFDSAAAQDLEQKILKPITEKDIDVVQGKQLQILKKCGVNIVSVRQDNSQSSAKGRKLKFQRFNVELESSWETICRALNQFERDNLVVITMLNMEPSGDIIKTTLDYNIYYQ